MPFHTVCNHAGGASSAIRPLLSLCRRLPVRLAKHTGLDKWLMQAIDPPLTEQGLTKSIAADIHKLHSSIFVGKVSLFFRVAQHACLAPTVPRTTRCQPTRASITCVQHLDIWGFVYSVETADLTPVSSWDMCTLHSGRSDRRQHVACTAWVPQSTVVMSCLCCQVTRRPSPGQPQKVDNTNVPKSLSFCFRMD